MNLPPAPVGVDALFTQGQQSQLLEWVPRSVMVIEKGDVIRPRVFGICSMLAFLSLN